MDRYRVFLWMETSRTYGRSILRGIGRYCRTHGPWVFLRRAPFYWGASGTDDSLKALRALGAHGMVLREQGEREQMLKLLALELPTVVSPYTEPVPGLPNILTDDAAIGRMAAAYLLERGFRHFAYCGFGDMYYWSRRRGRSFAETVRAAGFEVHCYGYEQAGTRTPHSWEKKQGILTDWLRRLSYSGRAASVAEPVGLMACNDDRGQDVLEACKAAGLRVPEQVAIVGVGNDDLVCDLAAPALSSIALSAQKAGYEAAALLDRWMGGEALDRLRGAGGPVSRSPRPRTPKASGPQFEGETPSTRAGKMPATQQGQDALAMEERGRDALDTGEPGNDALAPWNIIVRPSRVVTRQSTDVFAVADRHVLEALRFIHVRARVEAVQVDDVLGAVSVSRRSLYDRFARTLSRSVHEEIKRVRVDELARLLVGTDLPMSQIAQRLGCPDIKNLARYFKQTMGVTPLQYRHEHSPR